MVKVRLNKTVRYNGTTYMPNTVFEVKEADLDSLKKLGAFVIKEETKDVEKEETEIEEEAEEKTMRSQRKDRKR